MGLPPGFCRLHKAEVNSAHPRPNRERHKEERDPPFYYSNPHFSSQSWSLSRIAEKGKPGARRRDFAKIKHQSGQVERLARNANEAVPAERLVMFQVGLFRLCSSPAVTLVLPLPCGILPKKVGSRRPAGCLPVPHRPEVTDCPEIISGMRGKKLRTPANPSNFLWVHCLCRTVHPPGP